MSPSSFRKITDSWAGVLGFSVCGVRFQQSPLIWPPSPRQLDSRGARSGLSPPEPRSIASSWGRGPRPRVSEELESALDF